MEEEILGINEIATLAGVSSQAVTNWRARATDFPKPISNLASGPVFRRSQIRAWLIRNNRKLASFEGGSSYYGRLRNFRGDNDELAACIEKVANRLHEGTSNKPAMLLGQIQSGKTRGFVGVIAAAFDRGFDIALVVTKGTKTLSAQTVARLSSDFKEFIDQDEFLVLDIMNLPEKLAQSELKRKIVIVAKKQKQNLERLIEFMKTEKDLHQRRVLLVDDEADLASVRFVTKKGETAVSQGAIASQIDELRTLVDNAGVAFLQVTATPYSLYLQPEDYEAATTSSNCVFQPKRPAFTELLPIHSGYVGGDKYFGDYDDTEPLSRLAVFVSDQEQDALRRPDLRRISADRVLDSLNTAGLRRAISSFIVAVGVRRWQQAETGEREKKYAMIIHNDTQKSAHTWQNQIIDWMMAAIVEAADQTPNSLRPMFDEAFNDIAFSVLADGGAMPPRDDAFDVFLDAFLSGEVAVAKVNSDQDVVALLDTKSELRLRTPYNIFVGGNILDRGITVPNLLAFYYGRNPKQMQADTVLQHSRMYGNREWKDLVVTRFFTSRAVYDRLYTINSVENTLRKAFEQGTNRNGIAFIQADASRRVRACAPNKVALSDLVSVAPDGMLLPSGFDTRGGSHMATVQAKLEKLIPAEWRDSGKYFSVDPKVALDIINAIEASMEFDDTEFEWDAMRAIIEYYSDAERGGDGQVLICAETGRELDKEKSGDKSGRSVLGPRLRQAILGTPRSKPMLVLLQQEGGKERGWTAHRFWWPIFVAPTDVEPCVFATKVAA